MEKENTISVLEANRSRNSITTDMQTSSNQKKGFMAVTAHFIDDSWVMQSQILRLSLSDRPKSENEVIKEMAVKMIENFEKYWDVLHGMIVVATVQDPSYKMRLIEFYFPLIFGADYMTYLESILKLCLDLVKGYELKFKMGDENSICSNSSLASQVEMPNNSSKQDERLLSYDLFVSSDGPVKSEYDAYLGEKVLPRTKDFDILVWWRENAKDVLKQRGKGVLIKSVLANIPTYFWGDGLEKRKLHAVDWETVCKSKRKGGLGIGRILDKNKGCWLNGHGNLGRIEGLCGGKLCVPNTVFNLQLFFGIGTSLPQCLLSLELLATFFKKKLSVKIFVEGLKPIKAANLSPLVNDVLKFSIDGAVRIEEGCVGIGGILHNSKGVVLCSFSAFIGEADAISTELWAIHKACCLCMMRSSLIWRNIQIVDSGCLGK
ncbi:hypothetical protein Ddye_014740 [Dipteronia dyeriana]|uniref:hAT-like transposase RNase-H fold domain-containing protein n=1 Tax=Dipteronia dyeriana TaxID=168575 RepID=A0AAD9X8S0_9ROSI|nr:hypothetical protein Ddye_014740 [Dipteronia dyeriana]